MNNNNDYMLPYFNGNLATSTSAELHTIH